MLINEQDVSAPPTTEPANEDYGPNPFSYGNGSYMQTGDVEGPERHGVTRLMLMCHLVKRKETFINPIVGH